MQVMYTDIWTMPIYNWFKLLDTGNLGFINESSTLKAPDEVEVVHSEELIETRHNLNNQFFKEFGQSQQTTTILKKKIELVKLKANFLHTGNKMNKTFIEIKEGEIKALSPDGAVFDYNKEVGLISRVTPYPLNTRKISVHEYHTIKNSLSNGN